MYGLIEKTNEKVISKQAWTVNELTVQKKNQEIH